MIICQVDANFSAMDKENVEQELKVVGEVLAAIDGELIHADISMGHRHLVAYLRVESELLASDIFEASYFAAESITYLGPSRESHSHVKLLKILPVRDRQIPCGSGLPAFASARLPACPPRTPPSLDFRVGQADPRQGFGPQLFSIVGADNG